MPTPLPLRLRALTAAATFAIRRGWLANPTSLLDTPHDQRLARGAMSIACKPGDRRPDPPVRWSVSGVEPA